ncbi:MAG: DUF1015 domain-containing protein [Chitinophagaceae bacterium]
MAHIQPFKALRPQPPLAAAVAARPYDVLNSKEARAEAQGNPHSFLHVTKSEIDLGSEIDIHSDAVYEKAKVNLEAFITQGTLVQEETACYYIYQLIMNGRSQTGLVCVSSVEDYHKNKIKKHEFTRPEKEKDRIDHMRTIRAQTGNVFLAYRDVASLNSLIDTWKKEHAPLYDITASDGIQHTIWVVNDKTAVDNITASFEKEVPCTYIADGHHRAASAAKVSAALPESAAARCFLTTIFPASQLAILDYNRVVKDLNGHTAEELIRLLQDEFVITPSNSAVKPTHLHRFGMYVEGQWYSLEAKAGTYSEDPIGVLDITILTNNILTKWLGIKDQRTDKRIDFVGGIRGLEELEKRVNSGEMKIAFSLYPVSIEQLFAIADSGEVMPPKSTWFEPKLRDGLLTHLI